MKKSDITEQILKALEGKEMDINLIYVNTPLGVGWYDLCQALTTLTESGQIVCDNGRYKIKENNKQFNEHGDFDVYIHGLKSELTKLRAELDMAKGQWVSVDERLPDPYQQVIINRQKAGQSISNGYLDTDKSWYLAVPNGEYLIGDVTHWQPLPSPPQIIQEQDNEKI
jgi:hypothetical protein